MLFCDSSGLSVLLGASQQAVDSGAVLVLACAPPKLQRMLKVTGDGHRSGGVGTCLG
ncbi:STAS domain-containing protein [Streptomyces sp. NPDC060209]|uniref:STAS domain-containing protein n=1 Tax=Streptomyces sp. NPDC060209 TaxID=3347073 RepID=UPI00365C361E